MTSITSTTISSSSPPDASSLVTQVQDPTVLAARAYLDAASRGEDDDVYCIYNMRGIRRDLKRREAKLIPDPLAVHFKNGHIHVPWDQLTNWPWIPGNQTIGEDWEYRAIPIFDLDAGTLDWILEKIHQILEDQLTANMGSSINTTTFSENSWISFVREDLSYFVMPPKKMSTRALHLLKQKVGEWLLKRTDLYSALETNGQWNHSLYFLSLAGFQRNAKWERRFQIPNQISIISTACVPLRPNEGDEAEARKLTVFDQQAMRRTAWDYIWIDDRDLDLANLDSLVAAMELENKDKGKQPERYGHDWNGPSEMKMGSVSVNGGLGGVDETSHWGTDGVGVKVWLRRTIIYQLINLMERIVY